jgi:YHS domain-containing protein
MLTVVLLGVFMALLARAFWQIVEGLVEGLGGRGASRRDVSVAMVRDPVCGTFVLPDRAVTLSAGSQRLFFCSTGCRDKYRARTA